MRKASQLDGYAASVREERNTQRNDYQEDMRPTVYLLLLNTLEDGVQKLKISCSVLLSNLVLFRGLKISQTSIISGEKDFPPSCSGVMLKKLSRLSCSEVQIDIHRLFDVDIQNQVH